MSQRDFRWSTGRWLLWGVIAIAALTAITLFFINLGGEIEASSTTPPTLLPGGGSQVEWSIQVSEYAPAPGRVTLKGDTPLGFPTETWQGDFMLTRSVGGSFEWNMAVDPALPEPVYEIDQVVAAGGDSICADLNTILNNWANQVAQAAGEAQRLEASAFAQHAANTMNDQGCAIRLDS